MSVLLGTQPVFRQSPPMRACSTSVTLARTVAAISEAINPADPAPMTIRFASNRFGLAMSHGFDSARVAAR